MDEEMEKGKDEKETTDTTVKVKQEPKERVDIKDFAETTMNELLGWYGYDKVVDHQDTENLDLHRFTSNTPGSGSRESSPSPARKERMIRRDSGSPDDTSLDSFARSTSSTGEQSDLAASHKNLVSALTTAGEREGSTAVGEREAIVCQWCQKPGVKLFTLKTADGTKGFCSELCFTLCRRASFKKNKLCDWCKHVRHTVSFVDFQDGDQQLQFCSDKCLNQYKMNIFCKETQEHLQQIQSQVDATKLAPSPGSAKQILITPELWVNDSSGKDNSKEKCSDRDKSGDQKPKEDPPVDLHLPKPMYNPRSALYERSEAARNDAAQRSRAERTSPAASTSKPVHDTCSYERSVYPSERERLRRLKSRDSSSSTPISLTASPCSSQISTPRCSTSNDAVIGKSAISSSLGTRSAQPIPATSSAKPSLSSLNQPESHLMYHPLIAAGLGGNLPSLISQGVMPPLPLTALPPAQLLAPPKEAPTTDTSRTFTTTQPSTSTNPNPSSGANPVFPPPPMFNSPLWGAMPGPLPGMTPYAPYPGAYMPAMPHPMAGMMPPNTLMVPYPLLMPFPMPVPIPIPIPIPIKAPIPPITIKPEPPSAESTSKLLTPRAATVSPRQTCISPVRPISRCTSQPSAGAVLPRVEKPVDVENSSESENNEKPCENKRAGKIACACCQQTTTTEPHRSVSRSSSDGGSVSTSRSPAHPCYFSEPHPPPRVLNGNPILVMPDEQNDVIDLSKDSKHSSIASPRSDVDHNKNSMPLSSSPSSNGNGVAVASNPVPLLPPAPDPRFSARRSRILDAPSVPRDKNRSPSPGEKRMYYGGSQSLYGKRRCIRTRIKTK